MYKSLFETERDFKKELDKLYPVVKGKVSGLDVEKEIPNLSSIKSSMNDYFILKGIREIPLKFFKSKPKELFYAKDDLDRTRELAEEIKYNKYISPLIVVIDSEDLNYPYILEGGHRLGALNILNKKTFPALIVIEENILNL